MKKRDQCEVEVVNDYIIAIHCPREKYGKITKHINPVVLTRLEEVFDEKGVPHLTFYPPIDINTQEKELEDYEISHFLEGNDTMLYSFPFIGIYCCIVTNDPEETKRYYKIVLNILNDNRVVINKGDRLQYISNSGFEVIVKEITASGYRTEDMKGIEYFINRDGLVYWDVKNDI